MTALNTQLTAAKAAIAAVNSADPAYKNAVSARDATFSPLGKLITRINNALKESDTTVQVDESALTLIRELQGRRPTAKKRRRKIKPQLPMGKRLLKYNLRR